LGAVKLREEWRPQEELKDSVALATLLAARENFAAIDREVLTTSFR